MKHSSRVFALALLADLGTRKPGVWSGARRGAAHAGPGRTRRRAEAAECDLTRQAMSRRPAITGAVSAGSAVGAAAGASVAPRDLFKTDDNAHHHRWRQTDARG